MADGKIYISQTQMNSKYEFFVHVEHRAYQLLKLILEASYHCTLEKITVLLIHIHSSYLRLVIAIFGVESLVHSPPKF